MKKIIDAILILLLLALLAGCAGAPPTPARVYPPLHTAAMNGDVKTMKELLDGGAKINEKGEYYSTPLGFAVAHCRPEAVKLLLDKGADIVKCRQRTHQSSALHIVAIISLTHKCQLNILRAT
ncbi:MAG TPA: ankyrin repeat domain-containing protein [Smithellaceae bacterium]|nr:ankyrin repeat domain-containing protein [Smithellaceae bacterium]HPI51867.1 ankyrin repeat domain-containing protein [Smithellaceae bacterium]HQQ88490.1 ankyrin repeat domain-containing protein [Smithellaceae bacterium]